MKNKSWAFTYFFFFCLLARQEVNICLNKIYTSFKGLSAFISYYNHITFSLPVFLEYVVYGIFVPA